MSDYERLTGVVDYLVMEVDSLRQELELYKKSEAIFFNGEQLLSLKEASNALGKSKRTLIRAIKAGELKGTKGADNRWRIYKADLEYYFSNKSKVPFKESKINY